MNLLRTDNSIILAIMARSPLDVASPRTSVDDCRELVDCLGGAALNIQQELPAGDDRFSRSQAFEDLHLIAVTHHAHANLSRLEVALPP